MTMSSNQNEYAGHFSDTQESQSSTPSFDVEKSGGFMHPAPCITQGLMLPATYGTPIRKIRRKPASPDLRAEYLRSEIPSASSSGSDASIDLPMQSALNFGLGLGITLESEAGSSDALFDDSATITPMSISLSTHTMDRFNNESNRTVVPATPGKRTMTSHAFFSVSSPPIPPPIIIVSYTESQATQEVTASPKGASEVKAKSKSKSKPKSTTTKTKRKSNKVEESKSMQGHTHPPPLAPQLAMTRSAYSRHH